jgi:hypothetical protein
MTLEPEAFYMQVKQLILEMPTWDPDEEPSSESILWLGRMFEMVKRTNSAGDIAGFSVSSEGLVGLPAYDNIRKIRTISYRVLAYAEARAPKSAQGAVIPIGAAYDALKAIGTILAEAKSDILIVDPYMDASILKNYVVLVVTGVSVRLLCDSFYTKAPALPALQAAVSAWKIQYGSASLEIRATVPRLLHDRLIIIDGKGVWLLSQSLKDLANRSPASVMPADAEIADWKSQFYSTTWAAATQI